MLREQAPLRDDVPLAFEADAQSDGHHVEDKGSASFCIPRRAVEILLDNGASALEICAYLVLACHTDASGRCSTASVTAIYRATGANKTKGGTIDRALARLLTMRCLRGRVESGQQPAAVAEQLLVTREQWLDGGGGVLPDGPGARAQVRYILNDFGEALAERVWFGSALVAGLAGFRQPLRVLKDAGDVAARLLLSLYAANDMETWGGVRPIGGGCGPAMRFQTVATGSIKGAEILTARREQWVATVDDRICAADAGSYWAALDALMASGFAYEVVVALNRAPVPRALSNGQTYEAIPEDAEPLYVLDTRSLHGFKPRGEEGLSGTTALIAGGTGYSVANGNGRFCGTYAAIVRPGFKTMVTGIVRLRFRVSNPRNFGVADAWRRIRSSTAETKEFLERVIALNS